MMCRHFFDPININPMACFSFSFGTHEEESPLFWLFDSVVIKPWAKLTSGKQKYREITAGNDSIGELTGLSSL